MNKQVRMWAYKIFLPFKYIKFHLITNNFLASLDKIEIKRMQLPSKHWHPTASCNIQDTFKIKENLCKQIVMLLI